MTYKLTLGAVLVAAFLALAAFFLVSGQQSAKASPSWLSNILTTATTSASFAVTTSARVLATTTNTVGNGTSYTRVYATICNPNANPVVLNMNQDKAANSTTGAATYVIAAAAGYSACYEITDRNLYQGSIQASSTAETSTRIFVQEFVQ